MNRRRFLPQTHCHSNLYPLLMGLLHRRARWQAGGCGTASVFFLVAAVTGFGPIFLLGVELQPGGPLGSS